MEIERNENLELCKSCGGRCCIALGCHLHPDDIVHRFGDVTFDTIVKALETGDYSIDYWDGDVREDNDIPIPEDDHLRDRCYFMRARHKGGNPIDAYTRSGPCVNWTPEDGCKFSWEDRPAGGRGLIPQENKRCSKSTFDKVPGVISWIPFSDLLESVAESGLFEDTDCFTALADILG